MQFPALFSDDALIEESIFFEYELPDFEIPNPADTEQWICAIIKREGKTLRQLSYIFADDEYVHAINLEHLQHDTYTDIITFPYGEEGIIEGDIFISIDRVRENAVTYAVPFEVELRRVIIHGVLHLCGYFDKTPEQEQQMRAKEDEALALFVA